MNTAYSKRQYKILKYLYPDRVANSLELEQKFGLGVDDISMRKLRSDGLIDIDFYTDPQIVGKVWLKEEGRGYIEARREKLSRYWIPLITSNAIAIAALIVAILAYMKQ